MEQIQQEFQSEQDVRMNLGSETVQYTKVPIVGVKSEYNHNEDIELHFKKANKYLHLDTLYLVFKFVKGTDVNGRCLPYCIEDVVSCVGLRLNGQECLPNYRNDGRHQMTNFLRTGLRPLHQVEQLEFTTFASQTPGPQTAQATNKQSMILSQQLMKSDGTPGTEIYQRIKLCDVVPELKNLHGGILDLSQTEIQITLKMQDNSLLQYRALAGVADGGGVLKSTKKSNVICQIADLIVYQRTFDKKQSIMGVQMSNMNTMIQYVDQASTTQDFRVSIPHRYLKALVCFLVPKAKAGQDQAGNGAVDYVYKPPLDNNLFSATSESVSVEYSDYYLEFNSRRYRAGGLQFSDKQAASYLDSMIAVEQAFPNKTLNIPMVSFVQNKAAYIIPINPLNIVSDANTEKGVANVHFDWGTKFQGGVADCTIANFEVHAYFLVNQQIIGDKIER